MGLDSFLYKVDENQVIDDFSFEGYEELDEFFYARRNHLIHDWMADLYREKGGTGDMFNQEYIKIEKEDIDLFAEDIKGEERFCYEEDFEKAEEMIREVKIYLEEGKAVYYYSSW